MKKLLAATSFILCTIAGFCQGNNTMDSLRQKLNSAQTDTGKIWAIHDIAFSYLYSRPDSTMWYAQKALALSKSINYERGEIRSLNDIGNVLAATGIYSEAIEILLHALQKSEKIKDKNMEAASLGNLAETYSLQGDQKQAINLTSRSLAINLVTHNMIYSTYNYINLGAYYEKAGRLDSALSYTNIAYEQILQNHKELLGDVLYSMGNIQFRLGNDDLALPYFRKAATHARLTGNDTYLSLSYQAMAKVFHRSGNKDSSSFYLKRSYETSMKTSDRKGMLDAATQLASFYEPISNDSTLKYLKLSVDLKDSIFNQEKVKQVQSLTINEQLREAEIAETKNQERIEWRHNLQLMGIAAFIPLFFGVVLLLRRKRAKPRTIEFMGLLGLLLIFEFISLFIHPYIAGYTNHSPIFMLLVLVAVAALLVPTHHRLQKFVVDKLAHQRRKPVSSIETPPNQSP